MKIPNRIISLLLLALLVAGWVLMLLLWSVHRDPLLPAEQSRYPYTIAQSTDALEGGSSVITLHNTAEVFNFTFRLNEGYQYPYASMGLGFGQSLVDWSHYSALQLTVACVPANVVMFTLNSHDAQVTEPGSFLSYRPANTSFACEPTPKQVRIDLDHLSTPKWWLVRVGLPLSSVAYDLSKVFGISVENSSQSPLHTQSQVLITEAVLVGRDWRLVLAAGFSLVISALCLIVWWLRQHTRRRLAQLTQRLLKEQAVQPYKPVAVESKKDRDRHAVLEFMKTQYANPDLSLEIVTGSLGINRVKVNEILKEQEGLTFSTYLNKLRLTEAARLLREKQARVAEIGFMVGYNNASYFNRMFKKEYGCTPNAYKKTMQQQASAN